jgi:superfamily II DNA or RNA helicase
MCDARQREVTVTERLRGALEHAYIEKNAQGDASHAPMLVTNNCGNALDTHFRAELKKCERFTMSVAFISAPTLRNYKMTLLESGKSGTIYTSTMNYFNKPEVFSELLDIQKQSENRIQCRIFSENNRSFHPKGYSFEHKDHQTVIIGLSNWTNSALNSNYEWNIKFSSLRNGDIVYKVQDEFDYQEKHSEPITIDWINKYSEEYDEFAPQTVKEIAQSKSIKPNMMQVEALESLQKLRDNKQKKALLISATGTGKTILSALDVKQFMKTCENANVLFIAHTNTILRQAQKSFKLVLGDEEDDLGLVGDEEDDLGLDGGEEDNFGLVGAGRNEFSRRFVFANISSLRDKTKNDFARFDYVIIDGTHKAGAVSYQNLLPIISPKFLLGMTATPERTDGADIFKDFDYNIAYEIRLRKALDNDLLCPFHYYGVADLENVNDSQYDIETLTSKERVDNILKSIEIYAQKGVVTKGIIFCSRNEEATKLSESFNIRGMKTVALSGQTPEIERKQAIGALSVGKLDYIFVVDIFNEGADIPEVNLVIMLRQTQSSIIFTQQLGRGLRKNKCKEDLVVIDFIGNYTNNYLIPIALTGKTPPSPADLRREITEMETPNNNGGYSSVYFDKIAREKVLESIESARLSDKRSLKSSYKTLKERLNQPPTLFDFYKYDFIDCDPRLIVKHFSNLVELEQYAIEGNGHNSFTDCEQQLLTFLTTQFINGKRRLECKILGELLVSNTIEVGSDIKRSNVYQILNKEFFQTADINTFGDYPLITESNVGTWKFCDEVKVLLENEMLYNYVADIVKTSLAINADEYDNSDQLVIGKTYSRRDVCRLLNWDKNEESTIYGYKTKHQTTPIFVNLRKGENHGASVVYEDGFASKDEFIWYSRPNRTTESKEILNLLDERKNVPHLFVQKQDDNAENSFYYLGTLTIQDYEDTQKASKDGELTDIVKMKFHFENDVPEDIYNYLTDNGANILRQ